MRLRVRVVVGACMMTAVAVLLPRFVFAGAQENATGWAWSAAAGWISMNSTNCTTLNAQQASDPPCGAGYSYGVHVSDTGYLTGHAWSRTLGWICVGASCTGTAGAVPAGGWRARANALTGEVVGWAKILSSGDSGWISFSCENTRTCGTVAYRTTLDVAMGQFSGHAWNGARSTTGTELPAIGWIAWRPSYGGVSTTWHPEPRCSETGRACRTNFECELPGELCCLGGAPCGRCGGAGAECGLSATCNAGTICCLPGIACGRCVADGNTCGNNAECTGGGRDSCCPPGALCTRDIDARGGGASGGGVPLSAVGFCSGTGTGCVDDAQCPAGVACVFDRGMCTQQEASQCTLGSACAGEGSSCDADIGLCDRNDANGNTIPCLSDGWCASMVGAGAECRKIVGKCTNGEERLCVDDRNCTRESSRCGQLYLPWVQTQFGTVYSAGRVGSVRTPPPPAGQYNATYCVLSGGTIVNFLSAEGCGAASQSSYGQLALPKHPDYVGTLARLDVDGIRSGRYGAPQELPVTHSGQQLSPWTGTVTLRGAVYLVEGRDVEIGDQGLVMQNAVGDQSGAGTVIIRGGNLRVHGNISYPVADRAPTNIRHLASPGWLVLRDANGRGGDIIIDPPVSQLVGAFYAEGEIRTGSTGRAATDVPLAVRGVLIARRLLFERLRSRGGQPAEQVTADGRVLANPPPGFGDLARSLPQVRVVAPNP